VVVLGFAERQTFLPHDVGRVDTVDARNGVIGKMGAANEPLKGSDAISPSMSCHCGGLALQRTLAETEARHYRDPEKLQDTAEDEAFVPLLGGPVQTTDASVQHPRAAFFDRVCVSADGSDIMRRSTETGYRHIFGPCCRKASIYVAQLEMPSVRKCSSVVARPTAAPGIGGRVFISSLFSSAGKKIGQASRSRSAGFFLCRSRLALAEI
jgi:hypothetical protein